MTVPVRPPRRVADVPPALLRVTVVAGRRRVDLAVASTVPVAELLPELARAVGAAGPGPVLLTPTGRRLDGATGLADQDVREGAVLVVADPTALPVHDDPAEAVAAAVEHGVAPWPARATGVVATGAAVLWSLPAGAALATLGPAGGATAAGLAVLLLLGAGLLSRGRSRHHPRAPLLLAWLACGHAAPAGAALAPATPLVAAACGVTVAAGAGAALLVRGRLGVLGPGLAGSLVALAAVLGDGVGAAPGDALLVLLVLAVGLGGQLPRLALAPVAHHADGTTTPGGPDGAGAATLQEDVRTAHDLLVALAVARGLVVLVAVPVAASAGRSGVLLAAAAALVLLLGARRHRGAPLVAAGAVPAVLALAALGLTVLLPGAAGRDAVLVPALLLPAVAAALLVAARPATATSRPLVERVADLLETACAAACVPLAAHATGALDLAAGAVGVAVGALP